VDEVFVIIAAGTLVNPMESPGSLGLVQKWFLFDRPFIYFKIKVWYRALKPDFLF
jgi:hypothetical protein